MRRGGMLNSQIAEITLRAEARNYVEADGDDDAQERIALKMKRAAVLYVHGKLTERWRGEQPRKFVSKELDVLLEELEAELDR